MATVLLIATCIVTVSAARYVDYTNAKMPQYSSNDYDSPREPATHLADDDYQGHSVDAPASLDYKYEDEKREDNGKSDESVTVESRKYRSTRSPETNKLENLDSYSLDIDDLSKIRSNYRNMKHRSGLKLRSFKRDEVVPKRRQVKFGRKSDDSDIDSKEYFHIDKDFDVYKSKNNEDDEIPYVRKHTTERIIRRKPRDRHVKPPDVDAELEELAAERRMQSAARDYDYKLENKDTKDLSMFPSRVPQERYRPIIDEEEEHSSQSASPHRLQTKHRGEIYDGYNDYYDMKRVFNIKNKLPALMRRSTVRKSSATSSLPFRLEELLWRALKSTNTTRDSTRTNSRTTKSTSSTSTMTSTTTESLTKNDALNPKKSHELSLAEKSRLSILKKVQRNEGLRERTTNKLPVLLQVTKKMVTAVVVEPGTSQQPWMSVREISDDSPETVRQVKLLMRKKLIAKTKNIEDLNEDRDATICDYVDMSLVKYNNAIGNCASFIIAFPVFIVFIVE